METYSVDLHNQLFVFFFSSRLSEINARDRRETKKRKRHGLSKQPKMWTQYIGPK